MGLHGDGLANGGYAVFELLDWCFVDPSHVDPLGYASMISPVKLKLLLQLLLWLLLLPTLAL